QSFDANGKLILVEDPLATGSCTATVSTACFAGNRIPDNRISPISQQILTYYPAPNNAGVNNLRSNGVARDFWDDFLFKVDQKIHQNDNFAVRVLERWSDSTNPFSGGPTGTFQSATNNGQLLLGFSESHIFTPTVINEFC